jgi:hypothetical protein
LTARGTGEIVSYRPVSRRHDDVTIVRSDSFLHAEPVDEQRLSRAANNVAASS